MGDTRGLNQILIKSAREVSVSECAHHAINEEVESVSLCRPFRIRSFFVRIVSLWYKSGLRSQSVLL